MASRRSQKIRQIKNLCNKYLTDLSKQVLTPPSNSLLNRVKSCSLLAGLQIKHIDIQTVIFQDSLFFIKAFPSVYNLFVLEVLTMCAGEPWAASVSV